MTTFGDFPGVRISVSGGGIAAIRIGAEEKLALFGYGDFEEATADPADPIRITSRRTADTLFGEDSELSDAVRGAISNGANRDFLYAVMVEQVQADQESFTATDSGTLENTPIVKDSVEISSETDELDVKYVYDDATLSGDIAEGEAYVNIYTGEFVAGSEDDWDVDYRYGDWQSAFDASENIVNESESGVFAALSASTEVTDSLVEETEALRQDYKMIKAVSAAQPNDTDEYRAWYDTAEYEDNFSSDSQFVLAPVNRSDEELTVIGQTAGLFAGNDITQPVYNRQLVSVGEGLSQRLGRAEAQELRDANVIPLKQGAGLRVSDNTSASDETDWERDFWRRRIVDRVILIAKEVGDSILGRINDPDTRDAAEDLLKTEIEGLVSDRLLQPNDEEDDSWFVEVEPDPIDPDQVNIDIGVTPFGIAKRIDTTITIDT